MTVSCSDVCDLAIERLKAVGYEIPEEEDHEPILLALADVKMARPVPDPTCEICGRPDQVVHVRRRMLSAQMCISCRRDMRAELERLGTDDGA